MDEKRWISVSERLPQTHPIETRESEMAELRSCCRCGAVLSENPFNPFCPKQCLSCDHLQCPECLIYIEPPTREELQARIVKLEKQLAFRRPIEDELVEALKAANNALAVIHDSCGLRAIDSGIQTVAGRACDAARAALLKAEEGK